MIANENFVDFFIYAVGYETRSGYAVQKIHSTEHIALCYEQTDKFAYANNLKYAQSQGHQLFDTPMNSDAELFDQITSKIEKLSGENDKLVVVGIDVSSMQKELISTLMSQIFKLSKSFEILLRVIYTTGQYKAPEEHSGVYTDFHPIKGLEGWTAYPERPLSVVLGLGYEQDQAAGVIEYFDPSGCWAFVPLGDDDQFIKDVKKSNDSLWNFQLLKEDSFLDYQVDQPGLLYSEIKGLVSVLSKKSRVIMVPAGPKIFNAIAILVALELENEISLWRASSHDHIKITDTLPADKIVQFDFKFPQCKGKV